MLSLTQTIQHNKFYQDFLIFLGYVAEHSPKLTATKNINLKDIHAINNQLTTPMSLEQKIGDKVYRVRSQYELPYLRAIDALADILKLTRRFKGRLRIVKKNKSGFCKLPPDKQFFYMWFAFTRYLDWPFLHHIKNGARIAAIIQAHQQQVWPQLLDLDQQFKQSWITIKQTLETFRKFFDLDWQTAYGDKPDLARSGVHWTLFTYFLQILDLVEMNKQGQWKLTALGRELIKREVKI